jgi:biopolymer transport protein ExbD
MSFSAETRERNRPAVPLAAMVDVMFLLLIFFMTASLYREQERRIDVDLPSSESRSDAAVRSPIIITVTADERIYIGEGQYTLNELRTVLERLAKQTQNQAVVIRGDSASSLGVTVQVLDICDIVGLRNVSIATSKPAAQGL